MIKRLYEFEINEGIETDISSIDLKISSIKDSIEEIKQNKDISQSDALNQEATLLGQIIPLLKQKSVLVLKKQQDKK